MRVQGPVDITLVHRAQQGQDEAFTELFNLLHRPALNYIGHMLGDQQAAEDVTQDAFIHAHACIDQLGPPWDFKSWIFRIASNLAIDHLRRERRFVDLEESIMMAEPLTTRRPAERVVQRGEARRSVWQTLESMPTVYRQALLLREFNGLSYQEMSRALECSCDNVRQLVHRARMRFRERHGLRMALAAGVERCRELGDLVSAYHDGELDTQQRRAVRAHIAACPYCRETEEDLKKVGAVIAGLAPILPSPGWQAQVLERIGPKDIPSSAAGSGQGASAGGGVKALIARGGWTGKAALLTLAISTAGVTILLATRMGSEPKRTPTPIGALSPITPIPSSTVENQVASPLPTLVPPMGRASATQTFTLTPTSTVTLTPTEEPPMVTANMNSNCRFGPGAVYDVITYLLEGQTAPIDGRNAEFTWWWIERQDGPGHCWVWDRVVTVSGDTSGVPIIAVPPTPTSPPPTITPKPDDTVPPVVEITHEPPNPDINDLVTFSATASDNVGVARIEIWVKPPGTEVVFNPSTVCENSTTCTYIGTTYSQGQGEYYAKAWDEAGNMGGSVTHVFWVSELP